MTSRVVHFQIGAIDADRLADFYSEVFGWTVRTIPLTSPPSGPYHRITADDAGLSGGVTGLGPRGIVLTVEVDHIAETLERAEASAADAWPMSSPNTGYSALPRPSPCTGSRIRRAIRSRSSSC